MTLPVWMVTIRGFSPKIHAYYAAETRNEAKGMAAIEVRDPYPNVRYTDLRVCRCWVLDGPEVLRVEVCCPRPLWTYEVTASGDGPDCPYVQIDPRAEKEARRWRLGQYEARQAMRRAKQETETVLAGAAETTKAGGAG